MKLSSVIFILCFLVIGVFCDIQLPTQLPPGSAIKKFDRQLEVMYTDFSSSCIFVIKFIFLVVKLYWYEWHDGERRSTYLPLLYFMKEQFFFLSSKVFLWGQWYPCFGLLVTSPLGFTARVGSLFYAWQRYTFYMVPEIHCWCDTCWSLGGQHGCQADIFHVPASRHWWDYCTTSEHSTNWAILL